MADNVSHSNSNQFTFDCLCYSVSLNMFKIVYFYNHVLASMQIWLCSSDTLNDGIFPFEWSFFLFVYFNTKDQEQASTIVDLRVISSTKWYQKSRALKALFKVFQQATPILYGSAEVTQIWNQQIPRTQDILHGVPQKNERTGFCCLYLTFVWIELMFWKIKMSSKGTICEIIILSKRTMKTKNNEYNL